MSPLEQLVYGYNHIVLAYFALMNVMYLVLLYHASRAMLDRVQRGRMEAIDDLMRSPLAPGVTVVVPAFNEQECIVDSVRSLLALRYPRFQVIVVSDGSSDETVARLTAQFALESFPRVYVPEIPTTPVRRVLRSRDEPRLLVVEKVTAARRTRSTAALTWQTRSWCARSTPTRSSTPTRCFCRAGRSWSSRTR